MKNSQNNYLLKKRLEVLKFAKIFVSEKGLTKNSLENISKRYGIDINETELLFPEGNIDLIQFTLEQLNKELEEYCRKIDLIRLPVHKRIKKVLLSKISLMNKNKLFYRSIFFNLLVPKKICHYQANYIIVLIKYGLLLVTHLQILISTLRD